MKTKIDPARLPDKTKDSHRKIIATAKKQGYAVTEILYYSDPYQGGWDVIVEKDGKWADFGEANLERTLKRIENGHGNWNDLNNKNILDDPEAMIAIDTLRKSGYSWESIKNVWEKNL